MPKILPATIEPTKVFIINFAAAAGVMSILNTKMMPTDCKAPIIAKDKTIKKILSSKLTLNPDTFAPIGSKDINKNCL